MGDQFGDIVLIAGEARAQVEKEATERDEQHPLVKVEPSPEALDSFLSRRFTWQGGKEIPTPSMLLTDTSRFSYPYPCRLTVVLST